MALVKQHDDPSGNLYPASYWRAGAIGIDSTAKSITVAFIAWKDADAFQAGKSPIPGASKSYQITGPEFLAVAMSPPQGATLYDVLSHATENYALNNPDGFFQGAQQV